jgi:Icc-related predicted phosphoesterase
VGEQRLGIAGTKGFGGGFLGAMASEFGEPEMKAFVRHTKSLAHELSGALRSLDTDVRIAVTHYSPVEGTLEGERREIYPFLGSYLLAEAVDGCGVALMVHGHAHGGRERGVTPGGTPVRNVAQPVLGAAYKVYVVAV